MTKTRRTKLEETKTKRTKMHFDVCVLLISRLLYERPTQSPFYIILLNYICRELSSNRAPAEIKLFNSLNFYYVLIDLQVNTKFNIFENSFGRTSLGVLRTLFLLLKSNWK